MRSNRSIPIKNDEIYGCHRCSSTSYIMQLQTITNFNSIFSFILSIQSEKRTKKQKAKRNVQLSRKCRIKYDYCSWSDVCDAYTRRNKVKNAIQTNTNRSERGQKVNKCICRGQTKRAKEKSLKIVKPIRTAREERMKGNSSMRRKSTIK